MTAPKLLRKCSYCLRMFSGKGRLPIHFYTAQKDYGRKKKCQGSKKINWSETWT